MPLSINVGLSRKTSRDFQSAGTSINIVAELDATLLSKPDELQEQVSNLYAQAEAALERQAQSMGEPDAAQRHRPPQQDDNHAARGNGNGRSNDNGAYNNGGRRPNGNGSSATDSQRRAIAAIARRVGVDPALEARDIIGVELGELSLRQASELIDHLKSLQPASNGRNGR